VGAPEKLRPVAPDAALPRRVLYAVFAEYVGGAEEYVARLAETLSPRFVPTVGVDKRTVGDVLAARLAQTGVRVCQLPRPRPTDPSSIGRFLAVLRTVRPDVFHVNLPNLYDPGGGLAAALATLAGSAAVSTDHLAAIPRSRRRSAAKRVTSCWVRRVITVCEANRSELIARGVPAARIAVVPNGTPVRKDLDDAVARARRATVRRALGLSDDAVLALSVGALTERKDPLRLVEAVAAAARTVPALRLALAGSGDMDAPVARFVERAGLRERVLLLGDRRDVPDLLRACDLFVFPSRLEGMPFSLLEAMEAGCAVVATAVNGVPEVIEHERSGLLVPPGETAYLVGAIARLASDAALRARLGRAARLRIWQRFTVERMARATERVYDEVLTHTSVGTDVP
jgi:glycosyltransferase involved in cell wall biosynthesis